jgi:hypothetical protein
MTEVSRQLFADGRVPIKTALASIDILERSGEDVPLANLARQMPAGRGLYRSSWFPLSQ